MTKKTAIILGATGLIGSLLLDQLLQDDSYNLIKVFARRSTGKVSPKIEEYIIDLMLLEDYKEDFIGDEVYCCIGTTTAKTKDRSIYKSIDYGIPVTAAKLAKANGINTMVTISSMGADKNSPIFYNRTKGEMEEAVLTQEIKNTYILRPSLIKGSRKENRIGEQIGSFIAKIIDPLLIGKMKNYRSIKATTIANAMQIIVKKPSESSIVLSDEIKNIVNNNK